MLKITKLFYLCKKSISMLQINTICCALPENGSKAVALAIFEIYTGLLGGNFGSLTLDLCFR